MSGVIELHWGSECTKYEHNPVGRSHWIVTAESTLTGLSWNPIMEFSTAEPHGGEFLFPPCEQEQIPSYTLGRQCWSPFSPEFR